MKLLQKELNALSEQHTQKCLENSQLYQELQDEREALMQCQKENRGLQEKQVKACVWEYGSIVLFNCKILNDFFFHRGRRRRSLSSNSCQMGNNLVIPLE